MQETYFKTSTMLKKKAGLTESIRIAAEKARANGDVLVTIKTIHARNKQTWTLNMLEDNKGFAFEHSDETESVAGLNIDDAIQITKTRDNAFHETELLQTLRENDITTITLAGVSTHSCIFHTAAAAYAYNIPTRILRSAVGDENARMGQQALEYLENEYRQEIV